MPAMLTSVTPLELEVGRVWRDTRQEFLNPDDMVSWKFRRRLTSDCSWAALSSAAIASSQLTRNLYTSKILSTPRFWPSARIISNLLLSVSQKAAMSPPNFSHTSWLKSTSSEVLSLELVSGWKSRILISSWVKPMAWSNLPKNLSRARTYVSF